MSTIKTILLAVCCLTMSLQHLLAQQLDGAWVKEEDGTGATSTCIIADNYFMQATYNKGKKSFEGTLGGTLKAENPGTLTVGIEFNTWDNSNVGTSYEGTYRLEDDLLTIEMGGHKTRWRKLEEASAPLAGNWRITSRLQNGQMHPMPEGPRKTLKILSNGHFQWAAINTATKEFFGTGGGTYTFSEGKYTETLEFFSRDASRVGMSLSFDGKVEGRRWHHSGKSSKGDPVSEIWTR